MKQILLVGLMVAGAGSSWAQAPAGAPAGANGICKDGTYSMSASKSGACRGHNGVQTWYAAAPAAGAAGAKAATTTAPAPAAKTAPAATSAPAPAPAPAAKMTPVPTTAPPAAPAPSAAAAPAATKKLSPSQAAAAKTAAPGGGKGLVWVNTASNVYHCSDDAYYGKTKAGAYMSEADAKAKGAHGDRGQSCAGK